MILQWQQMKSSVIIIKFWILTAGPFSDTADQIRTKYLLVDSWTNEWADGIAKGTFGSVYQVLDGDDVWEVLTWVDEEYKDAYFPGQALSTASFLAASPSVPITVGVNDTTYVSGDTILVSGNVQAGSTGTVVIQILASDGTLIALEQVILTHLVFLVGLQTSQAHLILDHIR